MRSGYEIRKGQVGGHVVSGRDWALGLYLSFPRVTGDGIITYFRLTFENLEWKYFAGLEFRDLTNHRFSR